MKQAINLSAVRYPTVDEIACAIIAAAKITNEDPQAFFDRMPTMQRGRRVMRMRRMRCRYLAGHLLMGQFPAVPHDWIRGAIFLSVDGPLKPVLTGDAMRLSAEFKRLVREHAAAPTEPPPAAAAPAKPPARTLGTIAQDVIREELRAPAYQGGGPKRLSPPRSALEQILADAVRNTGGKPINS